MDLTRTIAIAGASGWLGQKIAAAVLYAGGSPRLLLRGGEHHPKAAQLAPFVAQGARLVPVDSRRPPAGRDAVRAEVTRLGHSLQKATRACRAGTDDDWVVATLLHDVGDIYAAYNHDEYAASILRPFVREQCTWVVEKHGDFQMSYYGHHVGGDPDKRSRWQDSPYFDDCAEFCELWDQSSFDPDFPTLTVEFFAPMVREVFARKAYDPAHVRPGAREPLSDAGLAARRAG
jgi:predicted HD phosphohydrolase